MKSTYRGRLAPTPSGYLHLGHAQTFILAARRAAQGALVLRIEDLDAPRCKPEYLEAIYKDLRWLGLQWTEGLDIGGPRGPYCQSERRSFYLDIWCKLKTGGFIYPCQQSRKDVERMTQAPHEGEESEEPIFPPQLRRPASEAQSYDSPAGVNWRFRVPDDEIILFVDERLGPIGYKAGKDFGDFLVWRRDDFPAYELAVVADDHSMGITEVVRGEDLLLSTARQILIYRALGWIPPAWFHTPLVRDANGQRLAKRDDAMSLMTLRERGLSAAAVCSLIQMHSY